MVEAVARWQGRTVKGDEFPDRGYFYRSDQFNFAKIGVPAFYLKPGIAFIGRPAEWGREQAELYTRESYHQASDEFDESWNYDGMVEDARLAFYCGLLIADSRRAAGLEARRRVRGSAQGGVGRAPWRGGKLRLTHHDRSHSGGFTWACSTEK